MSWLNSFISWFDYDWLRAGHILSVIAWMAGLLMLPRLIIYRLEGQGNQGVTDAMDKGALRLQKIILSPAMHAAWTFGLLLIWQKLGVFALKAAILGKGRVGFFADRRAFLFHASTRQSNKITGNDVI